MIAIDRTQWQGRNLFMVTIVWGTHALPLYWELLKYEGNSSLKTQKRLLKIALKLLKPYPVLVLGDREFHSPKLAQWLDDRGVAFALRQKKDLHFQVPEEEAYRILKHQGFQPGMSQFYVGIKCNKGDGLGPFNLAVYWKRKYRQKGPKEPWYILTNRPNLKQALAVYRCRWGIEVRQPHCPHRSQPEAAEGACLEAAVLSFFINSYESLEGIILSALGWDSNRRYLLVPTLA